jgi:DNA-directed RNA polymerase specialized sigma24 family protein
MADFYGSALYRHIEQKSLSMSSFTDSESEEFFRHFTPSAEEEFLEAQDEYLRLQSQQEWGEVLRQAMEKLIPSHRLCLNLRFVQNLSVEETARVMQKERGAIKTLQGRAVGSMRRVLKARGIVNW